jgi:hypothetical protein
MTGRRPSPPADRRPGRPHARLFSGKGKPPPHEFLNSSVAASRQCERLKWSSVRVSGVARHGPDEARARLDPAVVMHETGGGRLHGGAAGLGVDEQTAVLGRGVASVN